eukprot:CAMPEP_0171665084 /NCGR_PEP_ID=MMETSP0990-20121206/47233_1 /TAXON_ID=483369 /ORGANISM="non described non described, Strain CCMP2098" /LENGTH=57 /DNA_ID=CAMNT_0012248215 /DNA_START=8 /DNA_END=178 /DNA_ORIENTATION=+
MTVGIWLWENNEGTKGMKKSMPILTPMPTVTRSMNALALPMRRSMSSSYLCWRSDMG